MPGTVGVRDLRVSYGDNRVINGVDITFEPGSVTAVIGPSGCGKTTLLRCLNRLAERTAGCAVQGTIALDGEDIFRMDPVLLRRRVGMVFQRPNPFPMSVRENVLYGLKARGRVKDGAVIIEESLRRAALWDEVSERLDVNGLSLSIGQQQRLCIARALAVDPEVVLMDEPAAALDPVSTLALESSIMAMKIRYTVIVVTHDMHEALRVSDFTVFMSSGRIIEQGETKRLFEEPRMPETREYLAGRLFAESAVPV